MRARVAIAIFSWVLAVGFAGSSAARAAERFNDRSTTGFSRHAYSHYVPGRRAAQYLIYDNQPGVYVRSYWRAPWRNHHYFPVTGKRPRLGRVENMSARSVHKPAEDYFRFWSASSVFLSETPRERLRAYETEPPRK